MQNEQVCLDVVPLAYECAVERRRGLWKEWGHRHGRGGEDDDFGKRACCLA